MTDFNQLAADLRATAAIEADSAALLESRLSAIADAIAGYDFNNLSWSDFMSHVNDVINQLVARAQAAEANAGQNAALQQQLTDAQARITALQADAVDPAALQAADAFLATPQPGVTPTPAPVSPPTP